MSIPQRIRDWRHERYINRLQSRSMAAVRGHDRVMARVYWRLFVSAIASRSISQQLRMERRFVAGLDETSRRIYDKHRAPVGDL